ncbi:GxxExxY protein [Candidatus Desantisbacteria bacterium CG_4_10_14_0_8_um_filter_48_22]|uniref:GxxExxY protein n=1 Tax=Candidatus Desantisbacteria bacterium CG_4_10_14_0_8_um_filter_48_22 TaxID=1974543 RepID=A0A2M7S7A7_9BACT|nr:MAG: GxxExxY protein [Candidatus Desantisbacteria bacterium CG02_land_8_20_14_3_00_49_13]PIZ15318.1 MAG: GxxExxY protein [Candidatus Desantisbacteria bacterium CG_4_10_14_0_8_um_filter_48_22]PJB27547.1 MAG: GxxExxY protein [Candidatus Desantisbacteria bacterium CG_4_9_14_3_um_filter_50_7]
MGKKDEFSDLTEKIIAACFDVHGELGPGFVEKIYVNALKVALDERVLKQETEKEFSVQFHNSPAGQFRADIVVEDCVIIEIKAIEGYMPKIFEAQVISYLKSSGLKVGLLVNFGNRSCEIRRLVNPNF